MPVPEDKKQRGEAERILVSDGGRQNKPAHQSVCLLTLSAPFTACHLREQALPRVLRSVSLMPFSYFEQVLAISLHSCLHPADLGVRLAGGSLPALAATHP